MQKNIDKNYFLQIMSFEIGGETGIRTPEPVAQLLPFQGCAIDHSAISPNYAKAFYMN